jgi:hypothetical protein
LYSYTWTEKVKNVPQPKTLTFGDAVVHDPKKGELGFLVAQAGHQLNVLGCLWVYHRGLIRNLQKKSRLYTFFESTGANH